MAELRAIIGGALGGGDAGQDYVPGIPADVETWVGIYVLSALVVLIVLRRGFRGAVAS